MFNKPSDKDIILDSINEGVFTVNKNWEITSFNAAAERITGVPRVEAIGRQCCDVFRASICESSCALRRTLSAGESLENITAHIVNKLGERVPVRISTALLKNENDEIVGAVETMQDLSQIEQLKKELNSRYSIGDLIGKSPAIIAATVIILGRTLCTAPSITAVRSCESVMVTPN